MSYGTKAVPGTGRRGTEGRVGGKHTRDESGRREGTSTRGGTRNGSKEGR